MSRPNLRFFFAGLCSRLWLRIVGRRRIRPVPVTLNRFFAALLVFVFGISFHSCVFRRAQHHHHVPAVEERLGLDHPDLLDVVGETEKQLATPLRMALFAPPEHDRDLHLCALVQKPFYVTPLGVVVVDADLRAKLDLLHVDLALVLASLLRLLLLLVLVLAVVHDLRDRRVGLGSDLDEIEVLAVGVLAGFVRGLDSELGPVVVDQADVGDANRVVDARRVPVGRADMLDRPASGPQRQITKLGLLLLVLVGEHRKAAACSGPFPRQSCDSVEPRRAFAQEVRNGSAPAFQEASVASFARKSASDSCVWSPPRSRIARLASLSRSPKTIVKGIFSSSAERIRLPIVSVGSPTSTR